MLESSLKMIKKRKIQIAAVLSLVVISLAIVWSMRARQNHLDKTIVTAASAGDFGKVAELLDRGANPNGPKFDSYLWASLDSEKPPLYYAVSQGSLDTVKRLVNSGADIHIHGLEGWLLQITIRRQDLEMFELLLKLGADPSAISPGTNDFNTLHWIIEHCWRNQMSQEIGAKFAALAIQYGADANDHGMHGFTPLIYAISWQKEALVKVLLEAGADPTLRDNQGRDAMDIAAFRANKRLIDLLKIHGSKFGIQEASALGDAEAVEQMLAEDRSILDQRCFDGNTPLGLALLNGHSDLGRFLIQQGAALNHVNDDGEGMLHLAARGNCADIVGLLIDQGLDVNSADHSAYTPLHNTTFSDCAAAAAVLIKRGANIDAKGNSGITPMLWCASYDSPGVLRLLIQAGADPNARRAHDADLPLISACHYSHTNKVPESVKILLASGADVNKRDSSGKTAIHWAVNWSGGVPLVEYLLQHGADPTIRDATGKDALNMAREKGDVSVQRLLEKHVTETKAKSTRKDAEIGP